MRARPSSCPTGTRPPPGREFFHATPGEVKALLAELAGDLLHFEDLPEALEYRQSLAQRTKG